MCANYKYEVMELAEDYLYINTKKQRAFIVVVLIGK